MIDLREVLDNILANFGIDVVLFTRIQGVRCSRWDGDEHDAQCPVCGGSGWAMRWSKARTVAQSGTDSQFRAWLTGITTMGSSWTPTMVFFFRHTVQLAPGDLIYVVYWNTPSTPMVQDVYEARHVDTMWGDYGRVEYWAVTAVRKTVNFPFYASLIRKATFV